jgi:Flp pilus assembly pilin Flp
VVRNTRGQTMTEYALILATIAFAVYGAYKMALGNSIGTLASDVESKLRKRTVELETSGGNKVSIVLENWGSGLDQMLRRWTLEDSYWLCKDSAEIALEVFGEGHGSILLADSSLRLSGKRDGPGPRTSTI